MRCAARRGARARYTLDIAAASAGDVPSEADNQGCGHHGNGAHQMDPESLVEGNCL